MAERPEDLNLPNTVVARIIKEALPDGVNVSRDARLAISKSASIFVLYATSCANNFALRGKRKTITGNDVLDAMTEMEFERFVDPLKKALQAYKKGKFEAKKKKPETGGESAVIIEDDEEGNEAEEENGEEDGEEEEEENDGNAEDAEVVEVSD